MSRYEKNLGEQTLSVGWDKPMNTFFAQVHTNQADDDLRDLPLVLWLGDKNNQFTDIWHFANEVEDYGYKIPVEMQMFLRAEQGETNYIGIDLPKDWIKKQ